MTDMISEFSSNTIYDKENIKRQSVISVLQHPHLFYLVLQKPKQEASQQATRTSEAARI